MVGKTRYRVQADVRIGFRGPRRQTHRLTLGPESRSRSRRPIRPTHTLCICSTARSRPTGLDEVKAGILKGTGRLISLTANMRSTRSARLEKFADAQAESGQKDLRDVIQGRCRFFLSPLSEEGLNPPIDPPFRYGQSKEDVCERDSSEPWTKRRWYRQVEVS